MPNNPGGDYPFGNQQILIAAFDEFGVPHPIIFASGGLPVTIVSATLNEIVAFGAPINVGVLTPLFAFTKSPLGLASNIFAVVAAGSTKDIIVTVDVSADGVHAEAANQQSFTVAAGQANSFETGSTARPWWRMSAQSSDLSPQPITFAWLAGPYV